MSLEVHYYPALQIRKLRFLNKKLLSHDHNMGREAMCYGGKASRLGILLRYNLGQEN